MGDSSEKWSRTHRSPTFLVYALYRENKRVLKALLALFVLYLAGGIALASHNVKDITLDSFCNTVSKPVAVFIGTYVNSFQNPYRRLASDRLRPSLVLWAWCSTQFSLQWRCMRLGDMRSCREGWAGHRWDISYYGTVSGSTFLFFVSTLLQAPFWGGFQSFIERGHSYSSYPRCCLDRPRGTISGDVFPVCPLIDNSRIILLIISPTVGLWLSILLWWVHPSMQCFTDTTHQCQPT